MQFTSFDISSAENDKIIFLFRSFVYRHARFMMKIIRETNCPALILTVGIYALFMLLSYLFRSSATVQDGVKIANLFSQPF